MRYKDIKLGMSGYVCTKKHRAILQRKIGEKTSFTEKNRDVTIGSQWK